MPTKFPLVLANAADEGARRIVAQWSAFGARLLVPQDLSRPTWRYYPGAKKRSCGVAAGRPFFSSEISGVLVRLPRVAEKDLEHIRMADRAYVAAEMTAFLAAWLSSLPCPVLNRPVPVCLCGPVWRPEHWVQLAARVGIPVEPVRRRASVAVADSKAAEAPGITVTVVGERCFGLADRALHRDARRLARAAQVQLLAVRFSAASRGSRFLVAHPSPDLSSAEVVQAVLDQLTAV